MAKKVSSPAPSPQKGLPTKRAALYFQAIKKMLYRHYTAPLSEIFHKFRNGLIYFTVGFMLVFFANIYSEESLQQELIVLLGACLIAIGFSIAILAQIRMIITRFVKFFTTK